MALKFGYSVVAVECSPRAYKQLAGLYGGNGNVQLHNGCASDVAGTAVLHDASDSSSLHEYAVATGPEKAKLVKTSSRQHRVHNVSLIVMDSVLAARARICAVKLDTQGHELHVLKGMKATIARHRPTIYFEMMPRLLSPDDVQNLIPWVMAQGYECDPPNKEENARRGNCCVECVPK